MTRNHLVRPTRVALCLAAAALGSTGAPSALADQDDYAKTRQQLGQVLSKTSCTAEGQKQFDRALAMLHSFYFPETVKAFNAIPQ